MARYLVTCLHTPEECVAELDSIVGHSKEMLGRFDWGCKTGEHTGWAVVEAGNEATARMFLPSNIRAKASVCLVNKFTPEDIQSFHGR